MQLARALPVLVALAVLVPRAAALREEEKAAEELADRSTTTMHEVTVGDRTLAYEATAGTLVLRDEDGTAKAEVFHVAYELEGELAPEERPITFCFNGGPGSSSVWLHLGAFGPRRVAMGPEGFPPPPPYELVPNEETLLEITDLVFVDPPTTGYSRAAEGAEPSEFHGLEEDVEWMSELIRLWITRNERWASPKFLAGESYGTTRVSGLAGHLQRRHGMYLNGLVLVSSILEFQTARFDVGNDLPYPLFLPSYAATAFYHGKLEPDLSRDLDRTLRLAREFAEGPYARALFLGSALPASERDAIASEVARLTGLSEEYVRNANLRPEIHAFCKELRRNERVTVGRLDSRYVASDRDAVGEEYEFDPSYAAIQGPFTATLNHYVRRELEFESDLPYEILTGRVHPWNWGEENRYVDVAETLREAMTYNPDLHVFVANGYYDLATPFFATVHTFRHLAIAPELRDHVELAFYEAGHMMYVRDADRRKLKRDLAAFYGRALGR